MFQRDCPSGVATHGCTFAPAIAPWCVAFWSSKCCPSPLYVYVALCSNCCTLPVCASISKAGTVLSSSAHLNVCCCDVLLLITQPNTVLGIPMLLDPLTSIHALCFLLVAECERLSSQAPLVFKPHILIQNEHWQCMLFTENLTIQNYVITAAWQHTSNQALT